MVDRYWVGGTGSWDGTAGTKWAATSGGAGGSSVPTTSDDVFFDANSNTGSAITVTIAAGNTGAKSIDCTGFTRTIAGTASITLAGNLTLVSGMTYSRNGPITFTASASITSAGKTLGTVITEGSGITVSLADALTVGVTAASGAVQVNEGTFQTNNYNITANNLSSSNSNTRAIELGSSTIALSGTAPVFLTTSTNLTFDAGTSQITLTASAPQISGGGQTFYNVSFTSTTEGSRVITGANTFNNLTLNASATGLSQLALLADQTVNNTFTCAGSSAIARGFVRSNTIGTTRTITAATVSANDCDFRDITIAGAAAPISPTRAGDCGGNTGITFPSPKTVYWNLSGTQSWLANGWASGSGGTPDINNFPLAQDTAVFDDTGTADTVNINIDCNIGTIDMSARTTALTSQISRGFVYKDVLLGTGLTTTGSAQGLTFFGRGIQTITSNGITFNNALTINCFAGTVQLADALTLGNTRILTLTSGTFNAVTYNVTTGLFNSNNSNARTITMGSGLWTLNGTGSVWTTDTTTNLTFNKDTANILLSSATTTTRTFAGGNLTYNKLTIGGATGTSILSITGANTFSELASTKTVAHTVRFGANQTIDTWSVTGTAGNVVTVDSSVAGTRRTITLTNQTSGIDYLSVKDIGTPVANRFYVGANSTDVSNNLNIEFSDPPAPGPAIGNMFMLF